MADLFDKDHQEFIKLFNKHDVEYLLIGGVAVNNPAPKNKEGKS